MSGWQATWPLEKLDGTSRSARPVCNQRVTDARRWQLSVVVTQEPGKATIRTEILGRRVSRRRDSEEFGPIRKPCPQGRPQRELRPSGGNPGQGTETDEEEFPSRRVGPSNRLSEARSVSPHAVDSSRARKAGELDRPPRVHTPPSGSDAVGRAVPAIPTKCSQTGRPRSRDRTGHGRWGHRTATFHSSRPIGPSPHRTSPPGACQGRPSRSCAPGPGASSRGRAFGAAARRSHGLAWRRPVAAGRPET